MKNLIDRYLYDVARRLPEDMREDVKKELRSNIEDMLSENPTEEDITKVLTELGSPAKLAVKYHPNPRYVISPELFDDYITVFKIVAVTLSAVLVAASAFQLIFSDPGSTSVVQTVASAVTGLISSVFSGIMHAFFWVTLGFFAYEHSRKTNIVRPWSPQQLPEIPAEAKSGLKRSEAITSAVFSVFFTILFLVGTLRHPPFISWYQLGEPVAPLFDGQIVLQFLPLYIFMMLFVLVLSSSKVVRGRWTVGVAILQIIYSVFSAVVGIIFFTRPGVFTEQFLQLFADKLDVTLGAMSGYFHTGITVICVLIVIGAVADIGTTIVKTVKNYK